MEKMPKPIKLLRGCKMERVGPCAEKITKNQIGLYVSNNKKCVIFASFWQFL